MDTENQNRVAKMLRLFACATLLSFPDASRAEWGVAKNTVYDCEYDLTREQCQACPPWDEVHSFHEWPLFHDDDDIDDVFHPRHSGCLGTAEGCCLVGTAGRRLSAKGCVPCEGQPGAML